MKHPMNVLTLSILLALSGLSAAQAAVPSAGDLMKQATPVKPQAEPKDLPVMPSGQYAPPLQADDKVTVLVKGFKFTGNSVFGEAELAGLLNAYVNQQLGINKLQELTSIVTRYYRDRGYFVARAYLPQQTLRDGLVTIAVIEGRYGEFDIKNTSLVKDAEVQAFMDVLKAGATVSTQSLERQMLLINDLSGVIVTNAEVFPSKEVGKSDFRITTEPTNKITGYAVADNYGSRYTGEYRLSAGVTVNSLTGIGDSLTFSGLTSDTGNLTNAGLAYDRALGYTGWKGGVSASQTQYTLDEIENYEGTGTSESVGLYASYPLLKTRVRTQEVRFDLTHKQMQDSAGLPGEAQTAEKSVDSFTVSLNGKRATNLFGKAGRLFTTLSATAGQVNMDNALAVSNDADLQIAGGYAKANFNFTHMQIITPRWNLTTVFKSQLGFGQNLDSSEDLSVGGSNGVRAYEDSELSGDKGAVVSMDLAYSLPAFKQIQSHKVSVFVDAAKVWKNENVLDSAEANTRSLSAAGIGYAITYKNLDVKASWARGFGDEKTPTSEAEFSTSLDKFLIQGIVRF